MTEQQDKILVVDDDARLRSLLQRFLEEAGYAVKAVGDAEQMDRALSREIYSLMVLDLMLPGEDGGRLGSRPEHFERFARAFDHPNLVLPGPTTRGRGWWMTPWPWRNNPELVPGPLPSEGAACPSVTLTPR